MLLYILVNLLGHVFIHACRSSSYFDCHISRHDVKEQLWSPRYFQGHFLIREVGQWGIGERDGGRKEQKWMRRGRGRMRGDTLDGWWAIADSALLWKVVCNWLYGLCKYESTSIKFFLSLLRIAVIQHLVAAIFRSQQDLAMTSWYVMSYGLSLSALIEDHCIT